MKPGDLIEIVGNTCPMYPDDIALDWHHSPKSHIGYAVPGTVCILLSMEKVSGSKDLTFCRIVMPGHGPVWVRSVWVKEVNDEAR